MPQDVMLNLLYLPELREMLAENDAQGLAEFCSALHPGRTAEFMEGLSAEESWAVLRHGDLATRAEIFGYLDPEKQLEIIRGESRAEIGALIGELPPDDRVDLLNKVDTETVSLLLPHVPTEERRDIYRLSAYPEGTAGSVMTSEIAKLAENLTVRQALDEISRQAEEMETVYYVYIVDEEDHLRGLVSARQLVSHLGKPNTSIEGLIERDLVTANVSDDREEVAEKVARYNLLAIPVVDDEYHLMGIITHDDVIDVMREEATEDAHRLGAVEPLHESYLVTHWATLTWKRGMWLVILFVAALLTAFALQAYETQLKHPELTWLVMFIPLIISSGGNSGSQSATLIITAMTSGDVVLSDWGRVLRRELLMGVSLGGFLGTIGFFAAWVLTGSLRKAVVLPLSLLLVVICGTVVGSALPMMFRKLGLDPAMMSNPFVAGIIDIAGILIYMQVALFVLQVP